MGITSLNEFINKRKPSDLDGSSSSDLGFFTNMEINKMVNQNKNIHDQKIDPNNYPVVNSIYALMIKDVSSSERSLNHGNLDDRAFDENVDRVCKWIYEEKENHNSLFWLTLKTNSGLFQDLGQVLFNRKLIKYPIDLEIGYRSYHLRYISVRYYEMEDPDCFFCTGCERCISDKTGEQISWVGDTQLRFKRWRDLYLKEIKEEEKNRLETEMDHQDPTSIFHDSMKEEV